MSEHAMPRALVAAVVSPTGIKEAVLEDQLTSAVVDRASPHILKIVTEAQESGGITATSAQLMSRAKSAVGNALQPLIARYAMCLILERKADSPETLTDELISTAYRAAAISILRVSSKILVSDELGGLLGRLDQIAFDLSRMSSDPRQFNYLKKPAVAAVLLESAKQCQNHISVANSQIKGSNIEFVEAPLFSQIVVVFRDSGRKLNVF